MEPTKEVVQSSVTAHQKPPSVIKSVFHVIFVETLKDFFGNVFSFFRRYYNHYALCFRYLWHPTLKRKILSDLDWKENSQQSFELILLVLFALIFMVKLGWIPAGSTSVMEMLGNDLHQMGVELFLFICFAVSYLVAVVLSVLAGRLLRLIFELPVSRTEGDILFTYLNNTLLSLMLILSFIFRCSFSAISLGNAAQDTFTGVWIVLFLLLLPLLVIWSIRFCKTNSMEPVRNFLFTFLTFIPLAIFYSFCGYLITAFLFNI